MVGRARRATAKAVDYAKEQAFSDDDVFEDEEEEKPVSRNAPKRRGRPRKSVDVVAADMDDMDDHYPSKHAFTEKGYDPTLPPIRERFTFMPEYELDGSPRIELIVGRRPVDDKNAEFSDDEDNDASDEESSDSSEEGTNKKRSKKKKQAKKKSKKKAQTKESPTKNDLHKQEHVEYEYLVKYKGRSYLHLDWKTGADLESMNKSAKTLYRRYLKKIAAGLDEDIEDPNFDPSFAEPQKIVDESEQEITLELTDKELVDWEKERKKALAEEEAAAEAEADGLAIEGVDGEGVEALQPAKEESKDEKKEDVNGTLRCIR